jgi:hypothetical protein
VPTALVLSDRCWRIYFAGRDLNNRSHVFYADFDPQLDFKLMRVHHTPVLEPGDDGEFDASGVGPSCALWVGEQIWLYYTGVSLRQDVPYQTAIGLAISNDGGHSFRRAFKGPVMTVGPHDPLFVSMPCVWREAGRFRAVYSSATRWYRGSRQWECCYDLRSSWSEDGMHWHQQADPVLGLSLAEAGLGRQWVLPDDGGGLRMWLSHRGADGFRSAGAQAYRIQSAYSADGHEWQRDSGDLVWAPSPQGCDWDGWMQAYPCVLPLGDEWVMFYNGNDFGSDGFGWARSPRVAAINRSSDSR